MKILIVSTNRASQPVTVMPYGACIAAKAAEQAGFEVSFLDLMFESKPTVALEDAIANNRPDVIGLSIRNIDNNDLLAPEEYFNELPPLMETIRKHTTAKVIIGGAAVGVMAKALLRFTAADLAIFGDGERVFVQLLDALSTGSDLEKIPGIAWWDEESIKCTAPTCSPLTPDTIDPGWNEWVDVGAYRARMATVPLQSKRGCPFKCVYCTYGVSEGTEYRLVSPQAVAQVVSRLSSTGMRDIEFVDNVFNAPYDQAIELCRSLAAIDHNARLQSLELNPAFIDDQLLSAMVSAGFVGIGVTAESAADVVLRGLGKGFNEARLHKAAEVVQRHPLPCMWIFMLGGPGETSETVETTMRFVEKVLRPQDAAFFNLGIRIYPGTELEKIARRQGLLTVPATEMLSTHFYFSPEVDMEWVAKRVNDEARRNMNILNSTSLGHPWLPAINRLAYRLPLSPPLWRHTGTIRKILRVFGMDIPTHGNSCLGRA